MSTSEAVRISAADATGRVFEGSKAFTLERGRGVPPVTMVEMFKSTDGSLSAGIARTGPSRRIVDSWEHDEFMYFLEGGVTLTSTDGTVTKVVAGDALTIPRGWKGVWDTPGYTKYYVGYTAK